MISTETKSPPRLAKKKKPRAKKRKKEKGKKKAKQRCKLGEIQCNLLMQKQKPSNKSKTKDIMSNRSLCYTNPRFSIWANAVAPPL